MPPGAFVFAVLAPLGLLMRSAIWLVLSPCGLTRVSCVCCPCPFWFVRAAVAGFVSPIVLFLACFAPDGFVRAFCVHCHCPSGFARAAGLPVLPLVGLLLCLVACCSCPFGFARAVGVFVLAPCFVVCLFCPVVGLFVCLVFAVLAPLGLHTRLACQSCPLVGLLVRLVVCCSGPFGFARAVGVFVSPLVWFLACLAPLWVCSCVLCSLSLPLWACTRGWCACLAPLRVRSCVLLFVVPAPRPQNGGRKLPKKQDTLVAQRCLVFFAHLHFCFVPL